MIVKQNARFGVWQRASSVINAREKRSSKVEIFIASTTKHGNQLLRGRECCWRGVLLAEGVSFCPAPDLGISFVFDHHRWTNHPFFFTTCVSHRTIIKHASTPEGIRFWAMRRVNISARNNIISTDSEKDPNEFNSREIERIKWNDHRGIKVYIMVSVT